MKRLSLTLLVSVVLSFAAFAGTSQTDSKGGDQFTGTITAVEVNRDAFTVVNADGLVKIFAVSPDKKSELTVGQNVTVSYTEQYSWPLHTRSITVSGK